VSADPAPPTEAEKFNELARVVAELTAARDLDTLFEVIVARTAAAIGASVATLSVLDGQSLMLRLVGVSGGEPNSPRDWARYPLDADLPACEAVRNRKSILVVGRAAIEARYPALAGQVPDERSLMCLPLFAAGEPIGVIGLLFPGQWRPPDAESEFLSTFAGICAASIERVRSLEAARAMAERMAFLAEASTALTSNLDYRATLANLAELAVNGLAEWCTIAIVEDGKLRTVAVEHAASVAPGTGLQLHERHPIPLEAPTVGARVIRSGQAELVPGITDDMLRAAAHDEKHLAELHRMRMGSALVVPLRAGEGTFGVITLVSGAWRPGYTAEDLRLVSELAWRAAIAIDNARLHSETRDVSLLLQRAVQPEKPPQIDGWDIAVHYDPAGRTEIGGDFYDLIDLGDGRLVAVIGDVMGHGVDAAAAMAQVRTAVRAYAAIDPDPATVGDKLDRMFGLYRMTDLVTLAYLLLDPGAGSLSMITAGHFPPALVSPTGVVELLHVAGSPPLGLAGAPRECLRRTVVPGSVLLLYTDGLIERRDEDIGMGLRRLRRFAPVLQDAPLAEALPAVADELHDQTRDDDVTAVVIAWPD
jgi:GAF domain-containing protein